MVEALFALVFGTLSIGAVALVSAPLRRSQQARPASDDGQQRDLLPAREAALRGLRELDFDYRLGNLAETDYHDLRERQKLEAIALLRATNEAPIEDPLQAEIERRVREARQRRGARLVRSGQNAPAPAVKVSRATRWLIGGAASSLLVVGGVAWLYLSTRAAQADQRPIAQLPPAVGRYHSIAILPGQPITALIGYRDGLLASRDGGQTWGRLAASGDIATIASHPARPSVIYAAGHDVFLKSEDGARTWTAVAHDLPGKDVRALAVDPDAPNVLYASVADQGLFWSSDGGGSWAAVDASAGVQATAIAVMGGAQPRIYVASADQGILGSLDGRTWANASGFVNGALPTRRVNSLIYDQRSGDSYDAGSSSAALTGALYAGTDRGLFQSVDGGSSWTRLALEADVSAVAFDPFKAGVLLAVDAQARVFRSEDRGVTWRNGS